MKEQTPVCRLCGAESPSENAFCGKCGAPLTPFAATQAPPSGASAPPEADRRLVTILFADISGFTTLSERLDPEEVRDLITACFDRLVPCIEHYGGSIDKFIGDEVMALFGAPVAHENDPERALRAALEMREELAAFNQEQQAPLAIHFGVNTGLVYAGGVGGGSRQDYSVMGDAVNVAARLKAAAEPGEILVGADTYRLTGHLFDWHEAVQLSAKGKSEPVTAYRLVAARTHSSAPRENRGLSSPLVGREAELAAITERLALLRDGDGGVVVITGEAGLGKTRLVAEARGQAQGEGFTWLEGRTLSFGQTLSYWPLLEIIQQDAGIETDDPEPNRLAKLSARLTALFGEEAASALPYLATLLSLPLPDDLARKVQSLDGEAMGRQIYKAARLYFTRLAQERPTVAIFEDVHWLDGSSAALIEHLLPLTRDEPIFFCLVGRPEADTACTRLQEFAREEYTDRLTEISLDPLSPDESAALIRNLVQLAELPAPLRDTILEKAEGNPFFVEEVVRSLIDLGGVAQDPLTDRWHVTEKATSIAIPDTLQGVIMARIDRLDDDLKQVLRLASVVGRNFFYRVLQSMADVERELDQDLAVLVGREFIRERARVPELEYVFKHALVQEATYESILLRRRRELHARVARAIETLFPDRLEEFLGLLAYHYTKAEVWEKAQEYLLAAGTQAGKIAADPETLAHFEEALEAHLRAHGGTWGDLVSDEGIEWFLEWTSTFIVEGCISVLVRPVEKFHEDVATALGPSDSRTLAVAIVLARAYIQRGEEREAEALMEGVLAAQDDIVGLSDAQRMSVFLCLGWAKALQDRSADAEPGLVRALDLARRLPDPRACPDSGLPFYVLGQVYALSGRWAAAREVLNEGLTRADLQPKWLRDGLLGNLSFLEWALGEYAEAERDARAVVDESADPYFLAGAKDSLGMACLALNRTAEAVEHLKAAAKLQEEYMGSLPGPVYEHVQLLCELAEALLQAGRPGEAEESATRAAAMFEELPRLPSTATYVCWALTGVALARGRLAEAEHLLSEDEANAAGEFRGANHLHSEILYRKAQLRRLQGRAQEANDLLDEACRLLDERREDRAHPRALAMRAEWAGGPAP